jgi:hypothetical protein
MPSHVDASDVVTRRPSALLDLGLASEVLFVSADAKINTGDFHGRGDRTWPTVDGVVKNGKADVCWLCQI